MAAPLARRSSASRRQTCPPGERHSRRCSACSCHSPGRRARYRLP
ncbi:CxxxxCH/CxxCH domain-containing protein [Chelatococcus sp. GCM10030263]